jgi:hypothetical protein
MGDQRRTGLFNFVFRLDVIFVRIVLRRQLAGQRFRRIGLLWRTP